jgi:hypothetical protein
MLTQVEAARLMAAHEKALQAHEDRTAGRTMWNRWKEAERDFAELVSSLTDSEGL